MKVQELITINAPLNKTFAVFTDFGQMADRVEGIKQLRVLAGKKPQAGFKWAETRQMGNKVGEAKFEITDFTKNTDFTAVGEHSGMRFITTQAFKTKGNKTIVTATTLTQATTVGMRIVLALFDWVMKKEMQKTVQSDLQDLKKATESSV
ncbi:MAG: SRPBCC family protein [Candidatus Saccharibacteria bacterium]|nr:SRPBCC family protein [Candidatus Saccharibacteria bacterium]